MVDSLGYDDGAVVIDHAVVTVDKVLREVLSIEENM